MHEPNVHTHTLAPLERTTHKARMFTQHMDHIHTKHSHTNAYASNGNARFGWCGVSYQDCRTERLVAACGLLIYTKKSNSYAEHTDALAGNELELAQSPKMVERERTDENTAHARTLVLLWYVCTKKDVKQGRPALVVISVKR